MCPDGQPCWVANCPIPMALRRRLHIGRSLAYRAIFGEDLYSFASDNSNPIVVDGGANIGLATMYWKSRVPGALIRAYEPDEAAFVALGENSTAFGVRGVELNQAAIWTESGSESFRRVGGDAGHLDTEADGPKVETVALADLLNEAVDFLKLDIEGAEAEVLVSASSVLRNASRIFVEYHSFDEAPQRLSEILELLSGSGFRCWIQTEHSSSHPFVTAVSDAGMDLRVNIFASRLD